MSSDEVTILKRILGDAPYPLPLCPLSLVPLGAPKERPENSSVLSSAQEWVDLRLLVKRGTLGLSVLEMSF